VKGNAVLTACIMSQHSHLIDSRLRLLRVFPSLYEVFPIARLNKRVPFQLALQLILHLRFTVRWTTNLARCSLSALNADWRLLLHMLGAQSASVGASNSLYEIPCLGPGSSKLTRFHLGVSSLLQSSTQPVAHRTMPYLRHITAFQHQCRMTEREMKTPPPDGCTDV
jgi:hypothetical protein